MIPNLDELYGSFGTVVRAEVEYEVRKHGSLAHLLRRFNLNVPARIDAQHEILRNFLFQYGISFFLQCLRSNRSSSEVERLKLLRLVEGTQHHGHNATARDRRGVTRASSSGSNVIHAHGEAERGGPEVMGEPNTSLPYDGLERRSRDRRSGRETRRESVEVISRNRRFGGRDRRRGDRRQS